MERDTLIDVLTHLRWARDCDIADSPTATRAMVGVLIEVIEKALKGVE